MAKNTGIGYEVTDGETNVVHPAVDLKAIQRRCTAATVDMERLSALPRHSQMQQAAAGLDRDRTIRNALADIPALLSEVERLTAQANIQDRLGAWGDKTFTKSTPSSVLAHLRKEMGELMESHSEEEAADCAILLFQFAHKSGFSLMEAIERKFEIVQTRTWGEPDEEGVVEHVREPVTAH